jgi:hypothetical protein
LEMTIHDKSQNVELYSPFPLIYFKFAKYEHKWESQMEMPVHRYEVKTLYACIFPHAIRQ